MTRWSLFLQTLSLLHHFLGLYSWRLSNTLEVDFCVAALEEALSKGRPQIFNTDQGSQFTSEAFTSMLLAQGVQVSMEAGAGAWTTSSWNGCGAASSTRRCT